MKRSTLFNRQLSAAAASLDQRNVSAAAEKARAERNNEMAKMLQDWSAETGKPIHTSKVQHAEFKARTAGTNAVVCTGAVRPYANTIMMSGVAFS